MAWEKPEWLSIKDAADYLGVGEPTIYRWMREGRITYRKVGDSTRFLQPDLEAMIEVHRSGKEAHLVQQACPVCHHGELVEGRLQSTGNIHFRPDRKATRFWTLLEANVNVEARMCVQCGAITLFGDTHKLSKLRVDKGGKADDNKDELSTTESAAEESRP